MRPATVTSSGAGATVWLPLDPYSQDTNVGLYARLVSGTPTYTIEVTPDDVFDATVTPTAYPTDVAALTAATATASGALLKPARAVRINQTGAGVIALTAVVPGLT